jgi:hypothetical protein
MSTPELQPFNEFYRVRGTPLPRIEIIEGIDLPEPYRWMLDHDGTMTPRLQEFYGDTLHIRLLQKRQFEERLARQVALVLDSSEEPIEYGAININLTMFDPESRREIRESRKAFGAILAEYEVPHASRVDRFFRVWADDLMKVALNLDGEQVLYGRRNVLVDPATEIPLAETVEILSTHLNTKPE